MISQIDILLADDLQAPGDEDIMAMRRVVWSALKANARRWLHFDYGAGEYTCVASAEGVTFHHVRGGEASPAMPMVSKKMERKLLQHLVRHTRRASEEPESGTRVPLTPEILAGLLAGEFEHGYWGDVESDWFREVADDGMHATGYASELRDVLVRVVAELQARYTLQHE